MGYSKALKKVEDDGKLFAQLALAGDASTAMDIDQIMELDGQTSVIEFAKCECDYIDPWLSHPRNYPWNWRKYVTLSKYAKKLGGKLYVVNYATTLSKEKNDKVRVLVVDGYKPDIIREWDTLNSKDRQAARKVKLDYLNVIEDRKLSFSEFSTWLREQNRKNLTKEIEL